MNTNPRIYIACLAAYNNGKLHGKWIVANQTTSEIWSEVSAMLKASPEPNAEEWAMHDYEGFGEIEFSEWPDFARISALASLLENHGDAFSLWYSNQCGQSSEVDDLEENFLEQWQGAHECESAFADYLLDQTGQLQELPKWAQNYFDFESYARDLRLGGDYTFVPNNSQVYVFSNC